MSVNINKWIGRLGNNICQLYHCLQVAIVLDRIEVRANSKYFKQNIIKLKNIEYEGDSFIKDSKNNFFHTHKFLAKHKYIARTHPNIFDYNKRACDILKEQINFNISNIKKLNKNDLVIHLRGGDIFRGKGNVFYVCPPVSYYINIIENNKFERIIIVSEDNKNPAINYLLKIYPKIEFKIQSLEEDIRVILSTKNIIESIGTFIPAILLLSDNIKNIWRPNYQRFFMRNRLCYNNPSYNVTEINLWTYKDKIGMWRNKNWQKSLLLNWELSDKYKKICNLEKFILDKKNYKETINNKIKQIQNKIEELDKSKVILEKELNDLIDEKVQIDSIVKK